MKILLLNAHSPQNAGDHALLSQSLSQLWRAFPGCEITATINDAYSPEKRPKGPLYLPSFTTWLVASKNQEDWRWRKAAFPFYVLWMLAVALIYRLLSRRSPHWRSEKRVLMGALYGADVVAVIAGGHLYSTHPLDIAFWWSMTVLACAVVMRKKVVLLPQSFGPIHGSLQAKCLQWFVDRCAFVGSREEKSTKLLKEIGVRTKIWTLPDLAFETPPSPDLQRDSATPETVGLARPIVGLTLMDWKSQNRRFSNQDAYVSAVLELIVHLHERGVAVVVFCQCVGPTADQDDRRIARRCALSARQRGIEVVLIDRWLTAEDLKASYGQLDALVATRMHSAIFAVSSGVPTLVIGYMHKSRGVMEMLGLSDYVLGIDTLTAHALTTTFDRLWVNRADIQRQLRERVHDLVDQLGALPALIRASVLPQLPANDV